MIKPIRMVHVLVAALAAAGGLQAEDPWTGGFKLTAANFSGAEDASLGQNHAYGVAMFGAYPLGRSTSVAFEAGYRFFTTMTRGTASLYNDDRTDGYYLGATLQYRPRFDWVPEGLTVHGGLRAAQFQTNRKSHFQPGDGTSILTKYRADSATAVKPLLGLGYRFTEKYALELNLAPVEMKNVAGEAKSGTLVEVALLVNL